MVPSVSFFTLYKMRIYDCVNFSVICFINLAPGVMNIRGCFVLVFTNFNPSIYHIAFDN